MSNIIERIKEYSNYSGISVSRIESKIGASNGVIATAINKGSDIQSKWISIFIEKFSDVNPTWLITGKGNMLKSNSYDAFNSLPIANEPIQTIQKQCNLCAEKDKRIDDLNKVITAQSQLIDFIKAKN